VKKILVLLTMILILTGCKSQVNEKNLFYMDTYINVKIYKNTTNIDYVFDNVNKIYDEYNKLCDKYNEYDGIINVYYLNNILKNDEEVKIDSKLGDLLKYSMDYHDKTQGLFNIALGNVTKIWEEYREEGVNVPDLKTLKNAESIDIKDITLNENKYTKKNNVQLDLGGICKGYATEVVGDYLENMGINEYLINAGGNVKVGTHYDNEKFVVGIQDPDSENLLTQINVVNKSVVTSGSYQRYYTVDNINYHHIINSKTLYPTNENKSVTVISDDSAYADIMSTYLFQLTPDEILNIANNKEDLEVIIVTNDNEIFRSNGFSNYEK